MSGAPGTEGGAGSTKSRRNRKGGVISRTPWGPCLECSREVSPRGLPLLENQVLSTAHASACATSSGRKAVSGTAPVLPQSTMCCHKAPLAISRGGRSEVLGRSLCVIRVGIHQW